MDGGDELTAAVERLASASSPALNAQADELLALASIFTAADGDEPALRMYHPPPSSRAASPARPSATPAAAHDHLRLLLTTTLSESPPAHPLHLLLSLPPEYPTHQPPQLILQDRVLGPHTVSTELFSLVLRTFMHDPAAAQGVEWSPGEVCLFEGIEYARECCAAWVRDRDADTKRGEVLRAGVGLYRIGGAPEPPDPPPELERELERELEEERTSPKPLGRVEEAPAACPPISSSEPIVDRKSVFVGHAAAVSSPAEVQLVLSYLLSDRKIARATHNISAYRLVTPDGILHMDNDDDGESQAGSRLAHLLTLLDVVNVVVVVSRWFGGIHLGADRFKHINAAARDALLSGGFLDATPAEGKGKKGGKKR